MEKRKHPRTTVDLDATLTVEDGSDSIAGHVKDLSIGGMFFIGDAQLPFGTKVTVTIAFPPPAGALPLPAVVRWKREDGCGLQFGLVGAKETHAIAQAVRRRAQGSST